jgi:hypothetical protein
VKPLSALHARSSLARFARQRPSLAFGSLRALRACVICWIAVAAPRVALACSVCTAGREDETQSAFRLSTLFLSVLPLAMFGGFALWIWRRARQRERARDAALAAAAAYPPPSSSAAI